MAAKSKSSSRSRKEFLDGNGLLAMELRDIYSAETQLTRMLPKLAKVVESEKLRHVLEERQEQGERLMKQVDGALGEMHMSPSRKRNIAAEGLVNDARDHIQGIEHGPALDAMLIDSIQKTEHYCIAAWGTARSLAGSLQQKTAVKAMERALKEGKMMDEQLTDLAESEINPAVLSSGTSKEGDVKAHTSSRGGRSRRSTSRNGGSERRLSS